MIFEPTKLPGLFVVEPEPHEDDRGFFARSYCRQEFEEHGLDPTIAQCGISYNAARGTLRGMHYQAAPHEEAKLIRCTMGSIFDVLIDLRPDSPAFKKWAAFELSAANRRMLFAAKGLAHGFLTLADDSEVFYQISEVFHPESARAVRWDDPAFGVEWPAEPTVISDRDRTLPDFA